MVEENLFKLPEHLHEKMLCCGCSSLFSSSIWVVSGGEVCNECYEQGDYHSAMRSHAMEDLLKCFKFPCNNRSKGCKRYEPLSTYKTHASACEFNFLCPLGTECNPFGVTYDNFNNHLVEEHENLIKRSLDSFINIEIVTITGQVQYEVLELQNEVYFLKIVVHEARIKCSLHQAKADNQKIFLIQFNDKTKNGELSCFKNLNLSDIGVTFKIRNLTPLLLKVEIAYRSINYLNKTTLFKHVECPICNNKYSGCIFQCIKGHSICHRCNMQITKCPFCNCKYNGARNFALEAIMESLDLVPKETYVEEDMDCVSNSGIRSEDCTWRGSFTVIRAHLEQYHPEICVYDRHHRYKMEQHNHGNDIEFVRIFFWNYQIFRAMLYTAPSDGVMLSVQLLGEQEDAKKYKFTCKSHLLPKPVEKVCSPFSEQVMLDSIIVGCRDFMFTISLTDNNVFDDNMLVLR